MHLSQETKKALNSDQVPNIPILYVSESSGQQIQDAWEEGETQGMLGITSSNSLTQCRHSPIVLQRLTRGETTCSDFYSVELLVPTSTQSHLGYIFPGHRGLSSIIEKLEDELSEDDRIMEALLLAELQQQTA